MLLPDLVPDAPFFSFRTQRAVRAPLRDACGAHPDVAAFHDLGESEEGRPLYGIVLGTGPRTVSLIAGNHADEPVGPETLRTFVLEGLRHRDRLAPLLAAFRFVIVPHANPDGEARNRLWIERWPDLAAYLAHADREPPGRDLEFGFPAMRVENRCVADFLRDHAPLALHASLHGMAFSEGALLLVERHWAGRTQALRDRFAAHARAAGLRPHDHNRKGEKGFFYIEPGFTTTPEGAAMRDHFHALGDDAMARRFRQSSMEYARSLGGDPLCLVTELPLFLVDAREDAPPGVPAAYLALKERLPALRLCAQKGQPLEDAVEAFGLEPLDPVVAMRLQLAAVELGLERVGEGG